MRQVLGDYIEQIKDKKEGLTIVFSPLSVPLTQRWRNNSLSADFMADYFANFFPGSAEQAEIKSAISYIANELLENAMKFHYNLDCNISLALLMDSQHLVFVLINTIDPATVAKFQELIQHLLQEDPAELYVRQLEQNALDEHSVHSSMGLITMLHDYKARLGWKFENDPARPEITFVSTMVTLAV